MSPHVSGWLATATARLRPHRRTVRFRLTLLYSALFLLAGAVLLVITYLLVNHATATALFVNRSGKPAIAIKAPPAGKSPSRPIRLHDGSPTAHQVQTARQLAAQAAAQHAHDLHQLFTQSGIALGIMAVLAVACGWLTAGRVLRPLRVMTATAQQIGEHNLHERLALPGPADEIKDLADTIDGLLARLQAAFDAQRDFAASASHELRTPLTLDRALLEVTLADPAASVEDFRATCQDLLASGEQQERLIEALLTLASSERGLDHWEQFDLASVTRRALSAHQTRAERNGLRMDISLRSAPTAGDPDLAERLAANLIDNAIRYNLPAGHIDVRTTTRSDRSVLTVTNTGLPVPPGQAERLFQPFQRLTGDRASQRDGHGLGLAIVGAIVTAHHARLKVQLPPGGGLHVEVHFPPPGTSRQSSRTHAQLTAGL